MKTTTEQAAPIRCRRKRDAWPNRRGWIIGILAVSVVAHAALLLVLPAAVGDPLIPVSEILLSLQEAPLPTVPPAVEPEPGTAEKPPAKPAREPAFEPPAIQSVAVETTVKVEVAVAKPVDAGFPSDQLEPPAAEPVPEQQPVTDQQPEVASTPEPKPVAVPVTPEIDLDQLLREYAGDIKSAVLANKRFPRMAERLHHEGSAKVSFIVDAAGGLAAVRIKSTSCYAELDEAAVSAVRAAAPFAAIPFELKRENLSLSITLEFRLE